MTNDRLILIPIPALFSFEECLWFLNRNYDDCLHVIDKGTITKAIPFGGELYLIRIFQTGNFLEVNVLKGEITIESKNFLVNYVTEWFDLDRNVQPFYDLLKQDGRISYMAENFKGLRLIGISDLFETICWCIIGQQINLSFAYKVKRKLVEMYSESIAYEGEVYYVFPAVDVVANLNIDDLKQIQFSQQKADYMIGVAKAFANGSISKAIVESLPDFLDKKKILISLKGIGEWTANYAIMKSLRDPQCIPHGDIGLLNALSNHNIISDRTELKKIDSLFSTFAGWESYLVFYLWRSLTVRI